MKTCNGCRALRGTRTFEQFCDLHYKMTYYKKGFFECRVPAEICPKPKTYKKYFEARHEKNL